MISQEQILLRLVLATLLGSLIGWERERHDHPAGLRTHALVCVGASLFMLVSCFGFRDVRGIPGIVLDPSRVAAQVVSGIGFLGAGTIIFQRQVVRGLTTAASIWAVAAVGLAVGGGMYVASGGGTVLLLVILAGVKPIEHRLYTPRPLLTLTVDRQTTSLLMLLTSIETSGAHLDRLVILPGGTPDEDQIEVRLRQARSPVLLSVMEHLRTVPGVQEIRSTLDRPRTRTQVVASDLTQDDVDESDGL